MRSPRAVWGGVAEDERWFDERQVDVVDQIMREAFAAGFAAGTAMAAASIEGHAASGLRQAAEVVRELGVDATIVQGAWRDAVATFAPNAVTLQAVRP